MDEGWTLSAKPLAEQNISLMQTLDFKTYQYAFSPSEYHQMAKQGTMLSVLATVQGNPAGFAIWERGPRNKPAHFVRFGILPSYRRKKVGRQMLGWVLDDLKEAGKKKVRSILSQVTCLGASDPDDVSGFMHKVGFKWVDTQPEMFFHYGRKEDGMVFERDVNDA